MTQRIDSGMILPKVQKAIDYLVKNIPIPHSTDGGHSISYFDVWETINAMQCILAWSRLVSIDIRNLFNTAYKFLSGSENSEGMVFHFSEHAGTFCLETSSEYIRLLSSHRYSPINTLQKALYVRDRQMPSGNWNIVSNVIPSELQAFPSVTGFALRALETCEIGPLYLDDSIGFLLDTQDAQGHWGVAWEYYGSPYYPMVPILLVLSSASHQHNHESAIHKSRDFLHLTQDEDGSWFYTIPHQNKIPSRELHTSLALQSLFHCGEYSNSSIEKGVHWLLSSQLDDGSWFGGFFPHPDPMIQKSEDLYATSQSLTAILHYYNIFHLSSFESFHDR